MAQKRGIALRLELIFSFATVVDPDIRTLCRAVFGSEIADTYGAQEVGHIAAQCGDCGEYHISAERCLVEILRDDGSPAAPGEIGRVIVTPFYSYAMPFIRYELGDLAEAGTATPSCGRGLPTMRRILGRYRNLFRFRDGTTVWPTPAHFRTSIAGKQFQVVQTDFDHIEILYVPESSDQPIDLPALTKRVRSTLRQPVDVTVRAVDAIPRSRNGKYEDFISQVPRNDDMASWSERERCSGVGGFITEGAWRCQDYPSSLRDAKYRRTYSCISGLSVLHCQEPSSPIAISM